MAKTLTATGIVKLRACKVRCEIPDGGCRGLYLLVTPTGFKSFVLRARRPDGRTFKLTLGQFTDQDVDEPVIGAPLTLQAARKLAVALQHDRARGVDVVGRRHADKLALTSGDRRAFGQTAVDFIEQHARRKTRRWEETANLLGVRDGLATPKGLADRWRDRPVTDIDGDDIFGVVEEARERGIPGLARRTEGPSEARARAMFAALSVMFGWLLDKRRIRVNPCVGISRPDAPAARERVLKDAEVVKFWKAAEAERIEFAAPLKILLLTGCRLNEVVGMRRDELSDDGATWMIRGTRTKNGREHMVPLPPAVREILSGLHQGTSEYVFSTTDGRKPIVCGSKIKNRLDAAMQTDPWRLHDLRRTAATGMAEIGIQPHIVEACLNHVSGAKGGVAGVYNRAAYAAEKKQALERWASHVTGLLEGKPAKVLPLRVGA
jgi:integrase